jgi:hypothetical protein
MAKGLEIMKEWSIININLLLKDRCNNTMQKAISILGGIHLYWENIFGPANWSHDIEKNILLLILKIYFETDYIHDISDIIDYFELTPDKILLFSLKETLTLFDDILRATTIELWDANQHNVCINEAAQKGKTRCCTKWNRQQ